MFLLHSVRKRINSSNLEKKCDLRVDIAIFFCREHFNEKILCKIVQLYTLHSTNVTNLCRQTFSRMLDEELYHEAKVGVIMSLLRDCLEDAHVNFNSEQCVERRLLF